MEKKYIVYDIPSRKVGLSILEDIDDDELEEILGEAIEIARRATGPVDDSLDEFFSYLDEIQLEYIEEELDESYDDVEEIRLSVFKA